MSAKWTLDMAAMQEDFFTDTALIGIVSALPGYRFCWLMNQVFDTNFVREPDLDIHLKTKPGTEKYFPLYQYSLPLGSSRYLLYTLKKDKEHLLPEAKQLDYLWLIQSNTPETEAHEISAHLKEVPDVQLAQILAPERFKNLGQLLV